MRRNHPGVGQNHAYLDALDHFCKSISVFVLEVDWQVERAPKWQLQGFISVHELDRVDVRDKHVQHCHLVGERLAFFNHDCHLAVLVEGLDGTVVH